MPFINHKANSPERVTHLSDQWHAANEEWNTIRTNSNELSSQEKEVIDRLHSLQKQLLGRQEETMSITVMYRNNWFGGDGWTYYPKRITISAFCPTCGEHRGSPTWYHFCEDGEWFTVNQWENPCGHQDTYHTALVEYYNRIRQETGDNE